MTAANLPARRGAPPVLAAFVIDPGTVAVVSEAVGSHWPGAAVTEGGPATAAAYLKDSRGVDLVVVDLDDSDRPVEDLRAVVESCDFGARVVALGVANDLALYKDLVAAGATDYLVKPVGADELEAALLAAVPRHLPAGRRGCPPGRSSGRHHWAPGAVSVRRRSQPTRPGSSPKSVDRRQYWWILTCSSARPRCSSTSCRRAE